MCVREIVCASECVCVCVDWARALTGSKDLENRNSASPYWDDNHDDDDQAMMRGDIKRSSWKRDSGGSAGGCKLGAGLGGESGGELSTHDHPGRGSVDGDLSEFEDEEFEAQSFVSTECPSIRSHYARTGTTSSRAPSGRAGHIRTRRARVHTHTHTHSVYIICIRTGI